jgi:hypothetical protein
MKLVVNPEYVTESQSKFALGTFKYEGGKFFSILICPTKYNIVLYGE